MSGNESDEVEKAGLEVVRAVVDVARYERLVPFGNGGTPDWRVWMADGRIADVEVTTCPDGEGQSFFKALSDDGSGREWLDARLSHKWTVMMSDPSARFSERPLAKELAAALCATLVSVEAVRAAPQQMAAEATRRLAAPAIFLHRYGGWRALAQEFHAGVSIADWCAERSGYWLPELLLDHILTGYGGYELVHVEVIDEPELLGEGMGTVKTIPALLDGGFGHDSLVPAIQRAVDQKTEKRQLDNAPGLKWLAVMLDGIPGFQLGHTFGSRSHSPHPTLDGITFPYFDEVWVASMHGDVVLRLSGGGAQQHHCIVSRSQIAASG